MATNNDTSIQAIYQIITELQAKITKNSQDLIKVAGAIQLATPKQISNMLIDINNLQHETAILNENLKQLENKLNELNGKFNQGIIKSNEYMNKFNTFKKNMQEDSNKFFSWATGRELLIGILLAAILTILRKYMFKYMAIIYLALGWKNTSAD